MNKNYDAVLFDFDGTIADTGEGIFESVRYAVNALGKEPLNEKQLRSFIGPPIYDSFKNMLSLTDEQTEFAAIKYRECYAQGAMFRLKFYDGIPELLKKLRENGIKTSVASAKPFKFVEAILKHFDMLDSFDYIATPMGDDKPETKCELITRAAGFFGADKNRVLMVGDRKFDIEGANEAGVDSVGVLYGYSKQDELKNAGASFLVNTAKEIERIIFCGDC